MRTPRVLAAAVGAGLGLVGIGAVLAPRPSAAVFGLAGGDARELAFVRAAGARDVVLGLIVAGSLRDVRALRYVLACTSLVGLADGVLLAALRGPRLSHVLHLGGFAAVAALALTLEE